MNTRDKAYAGFCSVFHEEPEYEFMAPGRAELGGNHTDHQRGCVLACAVKLYMRAFVRENDTNLIRVCSEGYGMNEIDLCDLCVKESERNTTASLIRGIAAVTVQNGGIVRGFDAYITSDILPGSGLSSSAAFEVLLGTIINSLFNEDRFFYTEIARFSQRAENEYFGKPCGLMDQMAIAAGNIVAIDFEDPKNPLVERIPFDFSGSGYALCIVDTGGSHEDLTRDYAAIPMEMKRIAAFFGKEVLREIKEEDFYANIGKLRKAAGDRAVLRAAHFFEENKRAKEEAQALRENDFERFLALVRASGRSSYMYLQNVTTGSSKAQGAALAIMLAERLLNGRGAVRIHGGGFAGTIQAFVPVEMAEIFRKEMDRVQGEGSCHILSVESSGCLRV